MFSLGCLVLKLAQRLSGVPSLALPAEIQSWGQAASSCQKEQRPAVEDLLHFLNTMNLRFNKIGLICAEFEVCGVPSEFVPVTRSSPGSRLKSGV